MFMFNTFEALDPLRDAVGAPRFAFGFPAGVFALLLDGKLKPQIRSGTTAGDTAWAKTFTDDNYPKVVVKMGARGRAEGRGPMLDRVVRRVRDRTLRWLRKHGLLQARPAEERSRLCVGRLRQAFLSDAADVERPDR